MKYINIKSLTIITLFIVSVFMMPVIASADDEEEDNDAEEDQIEIYESYQEGFGSSFGEFGYGGEILESVFTMLLYEGLELEDKAITEGVYVLSAEDEETYDDDYDFEDEEDEEEIYLLPWVDEDEDDENDYNLTIGGDLVFPGYPYCLVEKEGGYDYELTVGVALTLLIWDYDRSFIEAAQRVINVIAKVYEESKGGKEPSKETIEEAIEVITWLIVHINEIFTGDELFVFNPIMWQTLEMDPWDDMNVTKTWYYSDDEDLDPEDDNEIDLTNPDHVTLLNQWNETAEEKNDYYMQWLLKDLDGTTDIEETTWTQFQFHLAQLWVKNFEISIDVAELAKGKNVKWENLIEDLDIEFFLFTHHLVGGFLFDDYDGNDRISIDYVDWEEKDYDIPIEIDEDEAEVPDTSEITHMLFLGDFDDYDEAFDFDKPDVDENNVVSWGLDLKDVSIIPVPVGVDLDAYLGAPQEELDYIEFGVEFIPELEEPDEKGEVHASADVKLEHNLAPWDGNDETHTNISGLGLALIYVSTVLYFHLEIEKGEPTTDPKEDDYIDEGDFEDEDDEIKVGNYLSEKAKDKLDFVDIAGEEYLMGSNKDKADEYEPKTSVIPLALWEGEYEKIITNPGEDIKDEIFTTDIEAEADFNVLLYAVCYPDFDGSRDGIWHDPTFSVYMIFTPESPGFWGLILLISGIGLAGVATILIKRRKEKKL